jgi:5'-3' exonuclease
MRASPERVLLVVDHKNLLYRSTHAQARLFHKRVFTGALYGVMVSVLRAVRDVRATAVVIATDSSPYVRALEFPEYKSNRKRAGDDAENDVFLAKAAQSDPLLRRFYDVISAPFWEVKGFEYDDLCAWAVRRYAPKYDRVIAMTNDSDLFQLFDTQGFGVYRNATKGVYTINNWEDDYPGLSLDDWVTFLSITGTHNAVPGIEAGIGPKTAMKILSSPGQLRQVESAHAAALARNRRLIALPHADLPADPGLYVKKHRFTLKAFTVFCSEFGITPTASMVEALQDLRFVDVE